MPRRFNVTITECNEVCTYAEPQDLTLTPATKDIGGAEVSDFNVAVGGRLGSGGFRMTWALNVFVTLEEAVFVYSQIVMIFCEHGACAQFTVVGEVVNFADKLESFFQTLVGSKIAEFPCEEAHDSNLFG